MNIGIIILATITIVTIIFAIFLILWFNRQKGLWNKMAIISTIIVVLCLIAIWVLAFVLKDLNIIHIQTN